MHKAIQNADVLWLAGGDTQNQFAYLSEYGLISLIRDFKGVVIGISAGAINMAKTAICTLTCRHRKQEVYQGLGLVDYSVEPHFDPVNISSELLSLSEDYVIHGLCDEAVILCDEHRTIFVGDIYLLCKGIVHKIR